MNPTQVDSEPTQPEVGFRKKQSSTLLATPVAPPKRELSSYQTQMETALTQGTALTQLLIHRDEKVYPYSHPA